MTADLRAGGVLLARPANETPPINFIYSHLHDSIRLELDNLGQAVLQLQQAGSNAPTLVASQLLELKDRYRFLEEVYKHHSSVEDEVSATLTAAAARVLACLVAACGPSGFRSLPACSACVTHV
jgi:hypothetical protein